MNGVDVHKYIRPVTLVLPSGGAIEKQLRVRRIHGEFFPAMPVGWVSKLVVAERRTPTPLFVGLILWQQLRMKKSQPLHIYRTVWNRFGLKRRTVYRALAILEDTGLITLQRFKHRSPAITIITEKK